MKGNSIHQVPMKKRMEWLKIQEEKETYRKIENAWEKEQQKIKQEMQEKIKV